MSFKIYTKTGDKGQTSLIGGTKVSKSSLRIDAYGTVDELNSYIGLVSDYISFDGNMVAFLREIQDRLFTVGASLACDPEKDIKMRIPDLFEKDVQVLEANIDAMNEELPEMKSFILPGGNVAVSTAHIARCVCRRAERLCVGLKENEEFIAPLVLQYLNRLSDHLFVLARWIGHRLNVEEIKWTPRV